MDTNNSSNSYKLLKDKLESRNNTLKERVVKKHQEAFEWVTNNTKQLTVGAIGSLLMLSAPTMSLLPKNSNTVNERFVKVPENLFMLADMKPYLPDKVGTLLPQEETKISEVLSDYYGFTVTPQINGLRLMHTYGYIGQEQHLQRYPGDNIDVHFDNESDANSFSKTGMAPGLGAFGYFANSKSELTSEDDQREKYYIAVQTFRAIDYASKIGDYRDFFKYRKMLVVNPNNGRAVVADIADSGPAVWTGKQLGGSPEVMEYLQRVDGSLKGPVLYFFIDDPTNSIPLGPVEPKEKQI